MYSTTMTNKQIYAIAEQLVSAFKGETYYLSAKINFYLQKNLKLFVDLGEEIENERKKIFLNYGEPQEDGQISIPFNKISTANEELEELLNIQQDIAYYILPLSAFDNFTLSNYQMQAILFMIEDDTKEKEEE